MLLRIAPRAKADENHGSVLLNAVDLTATFGYKKLL